MNRRIIKAVLLKKFNEWVNSIHDETIQADVKKNSIITGGAIVSLLMKEKVNDFDVYFTNLETVKDIANYYVGEFHNLHSIGGKQSGRDINPIVKIEEAIGTIPARVRIRIESAGIAGEKTPESQYRFFEGRPLEDGEEYVADIMQHILTEADGLDGKELDKVEKEKYRPVFLTDNAITLSNQIQLIIRFYGNADEIHKNYDFIHCTNYWESGTGKLTLRLEALESILAKELRYVGSLYPVCSFIRTRKFIKQGWHINAGQMLKICLQLSELDLTNVEVLEDQLTGVDTAYFLQVIDYLRKRQLEDSNFYANVPYLISIIDKIF